MPDLTGKTSVVGPAVEAWIIQNSHRLGLRKVWYGDDDLIPETPAVLVTPGTKQNTRKATGHQVAVEFNFYLTMFHSRFESSQITRLECDQKAELLEDIMHENKTLNGLLISSYVASVEYGLSTRGNVIMKSTRLHWIGLSQTRI